MKAWHIRKMMANHQLKKEVLNANRRVVTCNLHSARSVGLLSNIEDEAHYEVVKSYVKYLKNEGIKEVKAMCYCHVKEQPDYLKPSINFDFLYKKEVNFLKKAKGQTVKNFTDTPFDILIDLSTRHETTLDFLLASSLARFKVGKYDVEHSLFYDFMINVDSNPSLDYYITQLNHYLTLLNKP